MCFGCSKEPSHWDCSFEYPQHMFWLRNKKKNSVAHSYLRAKSTKKSSTFSNFAAPKWNQIRLNISCESSAGRQFTWNYKPYFIENLRKISKFVAGTWLALYVLIFSLPVTIFVVCFSPLLMFLGSLYCKQYEARSDCSLWSSKEQSDQGSYCLLPWKNLAWNVLQCMQQT